MLHPATHSFHHLGTCKSAGDTDSPSPRPSPSFIKLLTPWQLLRVQELCESRGGRPGLPVPNKPYGFRGREVTLNSNWQLPFRSEANEA